MKNISLLYSRLCSSFATVAISCLFALSANAQSVTHDGVIYDIAGGKATVKGLAISHPEDIVIADFVESDKKYPVKVIADNAFKDKSSVKSVVFGSNLERIGSSAFSGCASLKKIVVREGVVSIGREAFKDCSLRYIDLPSTLRDLGDWAFNPTFSALDTLVVRTAYVDEKFEMQILPFNTNYFAASAKKATLMVPNKALDLYKGRSLNGRQNWGYFFSPANIYGFGIGPSGYTLNPQGSLTSYRDLSNVDIAFTFDDEQMTDAFSFGPYDYIDAALLLPDGTTLSADNVKLKGNSIYLDFAEVLQKHSDLFIAPDESVTSIDVQLKLDGQLQLEDSPFRLANYFDQHPITWSVPLISSADGITIVPAVELSGEAQDGLYDYTAFETIKLAFDGYSDLTLDASTGAYVNARIYKNGELLASSAHAAVEGTNAVVLSFAIPTSELLVRRTSGVESYNFTLEAEGLVSMTENGVSKNFQFSIPLAPTATPATWKVLPIYIPEPTGVSFLPAEDDVQLPNLTNIAVNFEGVSKVELSTLADALSLNARILMDGKEVAGIGADKVRVEGNTLHLLFEPIDEHFITLITSDDNSSVVFTMSLEADLVTDGYPCRVLIGESTTAAPDASAYTQRWASPQWNVAADVRDVPVVTVNVPAAEEVTEYDQLRVIELCVDNYKTITPVTSATGSSASARLMRYGNPVCVTSDIMTEGNKIIIDFGQKLTCNAVTITPDDDPDQPIDLTLHFEGDLLFDGLPYHLVYDGYDEGVKWSLKPVVANRLPKPTVEHEGNRIFFTCGIDGVEYHYSVTNADTTGRTTKVATKNADGGSSLRIPLQFCYTVSVYATRDGYEDSEVTTVNLVLEGTPNIESKK